MLSWDSPLSRNPIVIEWPIFLAHCFWLLCVSFQLMEKLPLFMKKTPFLTGWPVKLLEELSPEFQSLLDSLVNSAWAEKLPGSGEGPSALIWVVCSLSSLPCPPSNKCFVRSVQFAHLVQLTIGSRWISLYLPGLCSQSYAWRLLEGFPWVWRHLPP